MAVRTIACLPAVTGHWRRAGGGAQLSTSGELPVRQAALERPDLVAAGADDQHDPAGRGAESPMRASAVRRCARSSSTTRNPAAVAPDRNAVLRGLAREDLFTVVLEHFQTDTADYADIVLPATTQLEHWDVHLVVRPSLRRRSTSRRSRRSARRSRTPRSSACSPRAWGLTHPVLADDDLTMISQALDTHEQKRRA